MLDFTTLVTVSLNILQSVASTSSQEFTLKTTTKGKTSESHTSTTRMLFAQTKKRLVTVTLVGCGVPSCSNWQSPNACIPNGTFALGSCILHCPLYPMCCLPLWLTVGRWVVPGRAHCVLEFLLTLSTLLTPDSSAPCSLPLLAARCQTLPAGQSYFRVSFSAFCTGASLWEFWGSFHPSEFTCIVFYHVVL